MFSDHTVRVRNWLNAMKITIPQHRLKQSMHSRLQRFIGREPRILAGTLGMKDVSPETEKRETVGTIGCTGGSKTPLLELELWHAYPLCAFFEVLLPASY